MSNEGKKQLNALVRKEVTKMFEAVLNYTAIAVIDKNTFKVLRGKILRAGNDCIRKLSSELDNYDISVVDSSEDIIEFNKNK